MGEGPISWVDIETYSRSFGLSEDQNNDLHYHVRALDNAYLDWRAKKEK